MVYPIIDYPADEEQFDEVSQSEAAELEEARRMLSTKDFSDYKGYRRYNIRQNSLFN